MSIFLAGANVGESRFGEQLGNNLFSNLLIFLREGSVTGPRELRFAGRPGAACGNAGEQQPRSASSPSNERVGLLDRSPPQ